MTATWLQLSIFDDRVSRSTKFTDAEIVTHLVPTARSSQGKPIIYGPDDDGRWARLVTEHAHRILGLEVKDCDQHAECHRLTARLRPIRDAS